MYEYVCERYTYIFSVYSTCVNTHYLQTIKVLIRIIHNNNILMFLQVNNNYIFSKTIKI